MTAGDADAVFDLLVETFADLDERFGRPGSRDVRDREPGLRRVRHLVATDPGGAWVTTDAGGAVDGAALGLVREGVFGLSLLVVDPRTQSGGRGRALMRAVMDYAAGTRGGLIVASQDARALRAYWRAGFTLRATFEARGPVRAAPLPSPEVRDGDFARDRALCDAASRAVREAAHGDDLSVYAANGARLLVHDGGGFAVLADGHVKVLAAGREDVARALLAAALAAVPAGTDALVDVLDAGQDWALDVALEAGLSLSLTGALGVRGDVGPLRPYVPSGAFL